MLSTLGNQKDKMQCEEWVPSRLGSIVTGQSLRLDMFHTITIIDPVIEYQFELDMFLGCWKTSRPYPYAIYNSMFDMCLG
jgi:galactose-1-phosphate uridylyltransferase